MQVEELYNGCGMRFGLIVGYLVEKMLASSKKTYAFSLNRREWNPTLIAGWYQKTQMQNGEWVTLKSCPNISEVSW
jgi:hypothetical protein